jgi:hypothetical protein
VRPLAAALAVCALAGIVDVGHAGGSRPLALMLGVIAVAVLATGLTRRRASAIVVSGALLIAGYALGNAPGDAVDPFAPLYGAGLLLMTELSFLTLATPVFPREDSSARSRYVRSVAAVTLGSLVVGEMLVVVAGVTQAGTRGLLFAGAAAAVASVAVLTRLALSLTRASPAPQHGGSPAGPAQVY